MSGLCNRAVSILFEKVISSHSWWRELLMARIIWCAELIRSTEVLVES